MDTFVIRVSSMQNGENYTRTTPTARLRNEIPNPTPSFSARYFQTFQRFLFGQPSEQYVYSVSVRRRFTERIRVVTCRKSRRLGVLNVFFFSWGFAVVDLHQSPTTFSYYFPHHFVSLCWYVLVCCQYNISCMLIQYTNSIQEMYRPFIKRLRQELY